MLNSRGDKWKPSDFLNCYIKLGVPDYLELKQIMEKHKVPIRIATDLLMFNKSRADSTDAFQSGEFQCKYKKEAVDLLNIIDDVFGRYSFSRDRNLIAAMQTLIKKKKCDFSRLKKKIASAPKLMDKQPDSKLYLNNIERVYNYQNSNREVIF